MNEISLTESLQQTLFRIPLFEGAPESLRASLTERLDARLYALEENEIVAHQGTVCRVLYVLLEGRVRTDLVDEWGNRVMIETIVAPRSFATPHLFSRDQTLPATFTATMPSTLLMAPRESVFRLISEEPYLLDRPTSPDGWFTAEHNTSQLAHYLCVTRPALSKEISKMVREGLIAVEGRRYRLLAEQQLRQEMG